MNSYIVSLTTEAQTKGGKNFHQVHTEIKANMIQTSNFHTPNPAQIIKNSSFAWLRYRVLFDTLYVNFISNTWHCIVGNRKLGCQFKTDLWKRSLQYCWQYLFYL